MKAHFHFKKTLLSALVAGACAPHMAHADPQKFSQLPPGKSFSLPAPNVILTVDDSGSMDLGPKPNEKTNVVADKRITHLKDALKSVFNDKTLLPDKKIRLAWQALNNKGNSPGADRVNIYWNETSRENTMKPLDATHRANFLAFVNSLKAEGDTYTGKALIQAYKNLSAPKSIDSPWAAAPGVQETPYLSCRRAYHIVMTDGIADTFSGGNPEEKINQDSTSITLPGPDNKFYDANSNETRVYRDNPANPFIKKSGAYAFTLSDWAFVTWATDLQPTIDNDIKPSTTDGVLNVETIGGVNVPKYWNPKHNPARWQHAVTYTIGFSEDAYKWDGTPLWSYADDDMYGGDYAKLVNGSVMWPDVMSPVAATEKRPIELWHMAINSRGKFYPTGPGRKYNLADAFREIVEKIVVENTPSVTATANSASTNIRAGINGYNAGYDPKKWSGYVSSSADWGTDGGGNANTTASLLDAGNTSTRMILTTNDQIPNKAVSFEWDAGLTKMSAAQKALLDTDGKGQDRVNFLRGERANEDGIAFRIRDSRQGDIVNSGIWYVDAPASNYSFPGYKLFSSLQRNRLPMLYVGGNDGMLHGFSAVDGQEKIAYVPKGVVADLAKLGAPGYSHRYFVDGSPFTGDLKVGPGNGADDWRTYLVGTLGAGGKGYFVLNVTQPGNKTGTPASDFSTSNASSLVVLDRTINAADPIIAASEDEDLGHIFASPVVEENNPFKATQIAKLNDDRWAVVMGNGYNSKNERPVLLIQYLDSKNEVNGIKELKRIVATGNQVISSPANAATDTNVIANGLSAPRLVDINSDGRIDVVYAGDLKGNLWKFDLTSDNAANWGVAVWGSANTAPCVSAKCTPLFTAISSSAKRQAITAAPTVKANDRGAIGLMVAFGTGVNLTDDDGKNTDVQSVYSVLDNTRYKLDVSGKLVKINTDTAANADGIGAIPSAVTIGELVQQSVASATPIAGQGKSSARDFWKMTQNNVNYVDTKVALKKGWYFNFSEPHERLLKPMQFHDGSNILKVESTAPAFTGNPTGEESCSPSGTNEKSYMTAMNIMDGKKPSVQIMDANGDGFYNSAADKDDGVSRMSTSPGSSSTVTGKKEITITGLDGKVDMLARMPEQSLRPSWRQLQ